MNEHLRIRRRRVEIGMSQEELAEAVGYTGRSAITRIETGRNKVSLDKIPLFAKALHTTEAYILGMDDDVPDEPSSNWLVHAYHNASDEGKAMFRKLAELYL